MCPKDNIDRLRHGSGKSKRLLLRCQHCIAMENHARWGRCTLVLSVLMEVIQRTTAVGEEQRLTFATARFQVRDGRLNVYTLKAK